METVTLVTAFYPIKSKASVQQYMDWAKEFLRLCCGSIILFTTAEMAPVLVSFRHPDLPPVHVIELPFEELDAWKLFRNKWKAHYTIDPENFRHSPELYAVWAQKPFFVVRAAQLNPFGTKWFVWNDIGSFRERMPDNIQRTYPCTKHFVENKLLMLAVAPMQPGDDVVYGDGIPGDFLFPKYRNGGTVFSGTKQSFEKWLLHYVVMLNKYFDAGRFAGKDQSVMLSTYLADRSLAAFVKCTDDKNPWFFLNRLFSEGNHVRFELDTTYL